MRRRDREITGMAEIGAIFQEAAVCRVGLVDGSEPYIVPLSFGYREGSVYLHSAHEGKKIRLLKKNPRACIEADICDGLVRGCAPCSWGMRYRSVIGYGTAEFLTDPQGKRDGLNCIMQHYGGGSHDFSQEDLDRVTVIRIRLDSVTGKKKG